MNPTTEQPPPPPPPQQQQQQQPLQPHRSSFSCDRHPEENFTGFCPSCLCERLTTLDQSSASSSRRPSTSSASTAAAALKSIFKVPTLTTSTNTNNATITAAAEVNNSKGKTKASSFFPELRRTKSFSASKNDGFGFSGAFEPQRKSCDVRGRNTLWSLFSIDDDNLNKPSIQSKTLGVTGNGTVLEEEHEDHDDNENEVVDDVVDEIRVSEEQIAVQFDEEIDNIVEEEEDVAVKTMKDHIDLDSQTKKPPSLAGFWSAASVFSKKWHKWRRKQKIKKRGDDSISTALPVEKPISRQYRETQSEIADYGFGRRSCDTDPRFSLDAGRISFDDPRYSFDEPRASWDGYLIGRGTFPRLPPMVEDAPVIHVARSDAQIPVEEPDENVPGGSTQTREYYSDSSSKRRKSLDRSNSIRKTAAAVVAEIDEMKAGSNSKVSPATVDHVPGAKILGGERNLVRDSNSNSLRDDCSETFELGFRDNGTVIGAGGVTKGLKKSRRWTWNIWGFIHRRGGGGNKDDEEEERYSRVNGVERSLSESWQELRSGNGDGKGGLNRRVFRSNSSVSWRNSYNMGGSFGSVSRKSNPEMNGNGIANGNGNGIANGNGKKRRDEFVLERNRSARYSPNHIDNGLLRFYLTPLRGSRRGGIGSGKSRSTNSHSIARSVLRLY